MQLQISTAVVSIKISILSLCLCFLGPTLQFLKPNITEIFLFLPLMKTQINGLVYSTTGKSFIKFKYYNDFFLNLNVKIMG